MCVRVRGLVFVRAMQCMHACMHMCILNAYNYIERYQRLARYLSKAIKLSEMGIMCSDGRGKVLLSVAIAMAMCHVSFSAILCLDIVMANGFYVVMWGVSGKF